ncbi:MAG: hypothetical protein GY927_16610 [bacterium]|nr:hypothetical protein [Gammaproteobacteria bacterium]MCP4935777.1 hypothetical protein [bacterium]
MHLGMMAFNIGARVSSETPRFTASAILVSVQNDYKGHLPEVASLNLKVGFR